MPDPTSNFDAAVKQTVQAYGLAIIEGADAIVLRELRPLYGSRSIDEVPGLVAEFLEAHPLGMRLANVEHIASKPVAPIRVAARAFGVRPEMLDEFVRTHGVDVIHNESTRRIFDTVGRLLDDDAMHEMYQDGPGRDVIAERAAAILREHPFRGHLVGSIDAMARGPFRDLGTLSPAAARGVAFKRLTAIPHFYREFCRDGEPADIQGSDLARDDRPPTREEIRARFGDQMANLYPR